MPAFSNLIDIFIKLLLIFKIYMYILDITTMYNRLLDSLVV